VSSGWGIAPWGSGEGAPLDTSPPTVTNFTPAPPGPLLPADTVSFDVVDDNGLRRVLVIAKFGAGPWEVIHDGSSFGPGYSGSVVTAGASKHYVVGRNVGWPDTTLGIEVHAIDITGNEA
jgi:hypothetical protein